MSDESGRNDKRAGVAALIFEDLSTNEEASPEEMSHVVGGVSTQNKNSNMQSIQQSPLHQNSGAGALEARGQALGNEGHFNEAADSLGSAASDLAKDGHEDSAAAEFTDQAADLIHAEHTNAAGVALNNAGEAFSASEHYNQSASAFENAASAFEFHGNTDKAAASLENAGQSLFEAGHYQKSAQEFGLAAQMLGGAGQVENSAEAYAQQGNVLRHGGHNNQAAVAYGEAANDFTQLNEAQEAGEYYSAAGQALGATDHHNEAASEFSSAFSSYEDSGHFNQATLAVQEQSIQLAQGNEDFAGASAGWVAAQQTGALGDLQLEKTGLNDLKAGLADDSAGKQSEAVSAYQDAAEALIAEGHPDGAGRAFENEANDLSHLGDTEAAALAYQSAAITYESTVKASNAENASISEMHEYSQAGQSNAFAENQTALEFALAGDHNRAASAFNSEAQDLVAGKHYNLAAEAYGNAALADVKAGNYAAAATDFDQKGGALQQSGHDGQAQQAFGTAGQMFEQAANQLDSSGHFNQGAELYKEASEEFLGANQAASAYQTLAKEGQDLMEAGHLNQAGAAFNEDVQLMQINGETENEALGNISAIMKLDNVSLKELASIDLSPPSHSGESPNNQPASALDVLKEAWSEVPGTFESAVESAVNFYEDNPEIHNKYITQTASGLQRNLVLSAMDTWNAWAKGTDDTDLSQSVQNVATEEAGVTAGSLSESFEKIAAEAGKDLVKEQAEIAEATAESERTAATTGSDDSIGDEIGDVFEDIGDFFGSTLGRGDDDDD